MTMWLEKDGKQVGPKFVCDKEMGARERAFAALMIARAGKESNLRLDRSSYIGYGSFRDIVSCDGWFRSVVKMEREESLAELKRLGFTLKETEG